MKWRMLRSRKAVLPKFSTSFLVSISWCNVELRRQGLSYRLNIWCGWVSWGRSEKGGRLPKLPAAPWCVGFCPDWGQLVKSSLRSIWMWLWIPWVVEVLLLASLFKGTSKMNRFPLCQFLSVGLIHSFFTHRQVQAASACARCLKRFVGLIVTSMFLVLE